MVNMNGTAVLNSFKNIKPSKTYHALSKIWSTQCNRKALYNFRQHQTVHTTVTQLEIPKQAERKATDLKQFRDLAQNGPSFKDFFVPENEILSDPVIVPNIPYIKNIHGNDQKGKLRIYICQKICDCCFICCTIFFISVFFDVYGCQMNVNDTEVIWSILKSHGYKRAETIDEANIILLVTCSIRDRAEQKIWGKLTTLNGIRKKKKKNSVKIGLLGTITYLNTINF